MQTLLNIAIALVLLFVVVVLGIRIFSNAAAIRRHVFRA